MTKINLDLLLKQAELGKTIQELVPVDPTIVVKLIKVIRLLEDSLLSISQSKDGSMFKHMKYEAQEALSKVKEILD